MTCFTTHCILFISANTQDYLPLDGNQEIRSELDEIVNAPLTQSRSKKQ